MDGVPKKTPPAAPDPATRELATRELAPASFATEGASSDPWVTLAAVERDTGLSRQTLRGWERQYGFPGPLRGTGVDRGYAGGDLQRLRLIKRLLDQGHAPSQIVPLALADLQQLVPAAPSVSPVHRRVGTPSAGRGADPAIPAPAAAPEANFGIETARGLALLRDGADPGALRDELRARLHSLGVERFIVEVAAPFSAAVGDAWVRGHLPIYVEHACTEVLQAVMRQAITELASPAAGARPSVLLSTFTGEPHALGLLMAEALLTLKGCRCISLGVQTPVWDLAQAAHAYGVDIVALSFSGCLGPQPTVDGLAELRSRLLPAVQLWAGGSAPVLQRRSVEGVWAPGGFAGIAQRLADWRAHARTTS